MFSFLYHYEDFYRNSVFFLVLLCVFTFWVPCCDIRYDFRIKSMFSSSLPPVICRRAHVLFTLFVFVCPWWCPINRVLCFYFVLLSLVYPMLPVSLNCPFLIAPSVFSNHYLPYLSILIWLKCTKTHKNASNSLFKMASTNYVERIISWKRTKRKCMKY